MRLSLARRLSGVHVIRSRYVVGWMVASRESADLARHLIGQTARKHGIDEGTLTLHADRGSSSTSKTLAELLIDLGMAKSRAGGRRARPLGNRR